MLTRLDHLVVLVRNLEAAVRYHEDLGFTVTPGGEHADGLTRNALIPFEDGSYLELVSFLDPEDTRDNIWRWRRFLTTGGRLIDYCAASKDLEVEVRCLRGCGFAVDGPHEGGRRLPDGREIRWLTASVRQEGRMLTFLIEDLTPRELRVPGGSSARHPNGATANGATGFIRLDIAVPEVDRSLEFFTPFMDATVIAGTSFALGSCVLVPMTPHHEDEAGRHLDKKGPGLVTAVVGTDGAKVVRLSGR